MRSIPFMAPSWTRYMSPTRSRTAPRVRSRLSPNAFRSSSVLKVSLPPANATGVP